MGRFIQISILLFCLTQSGFGQTFKFSSNHDEFLEQLNARFEETGLKKETKEFMEEFYLFWNLPNLTDKNKSQIIESLNYLGIKKAAPFTHFKPYINTYRSFMVIDHNTESFQEWHKAFTAMIQSPKVPLRNIMEFLNLTNDQITQGIIFSNASVKWKSANRKYRYEYTDKLRTYFDNTTIICQSLNDSIEIKNTSGVFTHDNETWLGESGQITWERSGFSPAEVYATFGKYKVQMDKPYATIDSATFTNRKFFNHPIVGKIEHKVQNIKTEESTNYPKFTSYEQRFKIDHIHKNMFYEGGFAQYGAKFLGSGTESNPASITIFRNDTLFISAKSMFFSLKEDQITSNDTEVKIHLDSAFIYHPGLVFRYIVKDNELHFIRNGEGLAKSPYFDTYHNISMDVELLRWKMDTTIIDMGMLSGAATNLAFFESLSYFREAFYNELQGMDAIHPLQGLKNCSKYFKGQPFTAAQYAEFIRMPINGVRQQVIGLSFYGFIGYNVNTDQIEIRDRLNDYLQFRLGKKDFDVIRFKSSTDSKISNATIDLRNYDLRLNGVNNISICDHQNVVFFPRNEIITLKQNRNFTFDGTINAGMLNLFGDGFKFSYENFQIDIKTIDSLRMQVQTGELDYFGKPTTASIVSTIAKLSGHLKIDKANNKSGNQSNPEYPILTSNKESFVYYEHPTIQNNAYKKDKFYFTLDTFQLDSINTLSKKNIKFTGEFTSNIFPTFRDRLSVRTDYSLGFMRQTPAVGFPIYGDKANYKNSIDLSNKGLHGNGILTYLTSTSLSEDFLFLPNAVRAQVHDFTVAKKTEGVLFPDVTAKYIKIDYLPYANQFNAVTQEENFTMYNKEAQLAGQIAITPTGLTGQGKFFMRHGNIASPAFSFADHTLVADSSNFNLTGTQVEGVSFTTTNLISAIDFEKRTGTFTSKIGGNKVEFTDNRYISYINEFSWDMDKNLIYMGMYGSKGNRFISIHKKQDSLDFYVPLARYDVATKLIECEEVKNIRVADANVKLNDGFVRIRENAVLDVLDSTTIVLNDSLHTIYDARTIIEGKYAYSGYGKYDYYNGENQKNTIKIDRFSLNEDLKTVAEGTITNNDFFNFNKYFAYKGKVALNASDSLLFFDGGVQMLSSCNKAPQAYVRFKSKIDPKNVIIPLEDDLLDYERKNLYANFFMKKDSVHIYSSFFEGRKFYSDLPIMTGKGFLSYNQTSKSFNISSMEKIINPDTTGTVLKINDFDCNVMGEGIMDFNIPLDEVKYHTTGTIYHDRQKDKITLSTLFGIDFFFNDKAILNLVADITASKAPISKLSEGTFVARMAEWSGKKAALKMQVDRLSNGITQSIPPELQYLLTFANIDWKWNSKTNSYYSDQNAELTFAKNNIVNREVKFSAEIMRMRSGNSIDLYIEGDAQNWYYFSYKSGLMQTISSNPTYNTLIQTLKTEERKMKTGISDKPFAFILSPESKKTRFLKRIASIKNNEELPTEEDIEEPQEELVKEDEKAK